MLRLTILLTILSISLCFLCSCDVDEYFSDEARAQRILVATPTELPPITTTGERTFGAEIITDTAKVLFVASGVSRGGPIGAESTSCGAWQNISYNRTYENLSMLPRYCRRGEIGDPRYMTMTLQIADDGDHYLSFRYYEDTYARAKKFTNKDLSRGSISIEMVRYDTTELIASGTFSGILVEEKERLDTVQVVNGRFDVSYHIQE